jgi:hypothetical protein
MQLELVHPTTLNPLVQRQNHLLMLCESCESVQYGSRASDVLSRPSDVWARQLDDLALGLSSILQQFSSDLKQTMLHSKVKGGPLVKRFRSVDISDLVLVSPALYPRGLP